MSDDMELSDTLMHRVIETSHGPILLILDYFDPETVREHLLGYSHYAGREIFIYEDELLTVREQHGEVDAYGFWHVLLLNGYIELAADKIFYYETAENNGYYLKCTDSGDIEASGRVAGGRVVLGRDSVQLSEIEDHLVRINDSLATINFFDVSLPDEPARSALEGIQARRAKKQRTFLGIFVVLALVFLGGIVSDWALERWHKSRMVELGLLQSRVDERQGAAGRLEHRFVTSLPDHSAVILRLYYVYSLATGIEMARQSFSSDRFELRVDRTSAIAPSPQIDVRPRPDQWLDVVIKAGVSSSVSAEGEEPFIESN